MRAVDVILLTAIARRGRSSKKTARLTTEMVASGARIDSHTLEFVPGLRVRFSILTAVLAGFLL
jgi:hypothetical protein